MGNTWTSSSQENSRSSPAAPPALATPSPKRSAAEGARVIVNGRSRSGVDAALAAHRKATNKDAIGFAGDLVDAAVAEALVREHPGIEILVNNLGIFEPKPFEEIPDADWRRFFDVNVLQRRAPRAAGAAGDAPRATGAASSSSPARAACRFPRR